MTAEQRSNPDRYRRALEGLVGIPATEGNTVDVLRNGVEIFPAMLDAIRGATRTVDLCTYVYWTGDVALKFADACSDRARAGVRVRILLDAVGAMQMSRDLAHQMEDAGCHVEWFREPTRIRSANNRTHRKLLICDEDVAFTGGVGIAEEWEGDARDPAEWRETHVRVRGPAVDGLRAAFAANWAETGRPLFGDADRFPDQPQAGGSVVQVVQCPSQIGWGALASLFAAMLQLAEERIRITTAYFVPDDRFLALLLEARRRGVYVDVLVPGEHTDKRVVQIAGEADYERLLDAGVRVWRYAPTMLHAKVITVDGLVATVGSANFDPRSLRANEEANLVILDPDVVSVLDEHFAEDLARSELMDAESWARRGPLQRAREAVVDLFDEQL
ncbi:MAG TPA: phospholipase D-like domain-containing protein [Egibacteraceae bacterium]|nr:phospholipase D-like domain-containing protein [Egibacteraceae bacterium]